MRTILAVALFVFLFSVKIFSQIKPGARQIALAHSDVALSNDVFSIFNNPAGAAELPNFQIGVYYSPSPFELKELANGFSSITEPLKFGVLSAGFMFYGYELYKENKLSFSFSKKLFENFLAGLTINYHSLSIAKYGTAKSFSLNIGTIAKITKNFQAGFYIENITKSTFANQPNQIPTNLWVGAMYIPIQPIKLFFALQKDIDYDPSFRFGIEYEIIDYLLLRSGFNNYPSTYNLGIGIVWKFLEFDYALFTHQDLGLTHQGGLVIRFDN
ncbi:hypothetical protein ABRY23_01260 [Melioribacteraceae bacterium 4301-Me]|uniref:hypothetical protein n=1 Tax=Pyranulibacter aquaticus TaxID=3163344 RepID=UPI003599F195